MLKGERGKRCQRPPKAAPPPDAHCQKTDLSRVQSAKAFLFSTNATATLSRSFARSLGASHFFYTSLLGHLFPRRRFLSFTLLWGILQPTRFLSFTLLFGISFLPPSFPSFMLLWGYFFPPSDFFHLLHFSLSISFPLWPSHLLHTSLSHFFFALLRFPSFDTSLAHFFRHPGFPAFTLLLSWSFLSTSLAIPSFPVYTFTPLLENFFSSS